MNAEVVVLGVLAALMGVGLLVFLSECSGVILAQ